MRSPGQHARKGSQGHPARQQHRRGRHIPVEAISDRQHQQRLLIAQRNRLAWAMDDRAALIVKLRGKVVHHRLANAIHHQPITEVQNGAALVPPGAPAPQRFQIKDSNSCLLAEQIRGRCCPTDAPFRRVEGFPVSQRRQPAEIHRAMGRRCQPHHLAGGTGLVIEVVAFKAEALEGAAAPWR